jgi:hypothetical protein
MPNKKDKNLDFMDFVWYAATTNEGNETTWVREFLEMLGEPDATAGKLCDFLKDKGYEGVRIKDCQTLLEVSKKVNGVRPRWRWHIHDLEQDDY